MERHVPKGAFHEARKRNLKSNYTVDFTLEAFYKGGQVQLSQDGKRFFFSCGSVLKVVDPSSGSVTKTIGEIEDMDDLVTFSLSPDDASIITYSRSGILRCWDLNTYTVTRSWKSTHIGPISRLAFHMSSNLLASGGSDGTIKVWDLPKQYCTHNFTGAQGVFSVVQFNPDAGSDLVFGAADDYKIHVWSLSNKQPVAHLPGHFSTVTSLDFNLEKKTMISSGRDRVVFVWNLVQYQVLKTVPIFEEVESVFWLPKGWKVPSSDVPLEGLHFITAGNKGVLKAWSVGTASPVHASEEKKNLPCYSSAFYSPALGSVVAVTHEHNVLLYKLDSLCLSKQLIGNSDEVTDMILIGEKESHLVVATNSALIKVFELASRDCQVLEGHTDLVLSLSAFPTRKEWFASSAKDSSVRVWQMSPETKLVSCMFTGVGHTRNVTAVACSRSGTGFLVSGSEDLTIKLWEIPEKVRLVLACPSLTSVCTVRAHAKDINSMDIAPNNSLLATGSQDKTAKIWNVENLSLEGTLQGHRKGIWCVQFSPVDQVVATSSADGTIKIWALSDYSCTKTFEGHDCSVLKVYFLSKGMQMISSGSNGNIKLWNIKSNDCVKTLDEHEDQVWALAISSNEDTFMSGGSDAKIVSWKDVTRDEIEEVLKKEENLILQEQEIQNLLHDKKWLKALKKAILLDQPHRTLTIVKEILLQENFEAHFERALKELTNDEIRVLLRYCLAWNTNSKHCAAAQAVLVVVFKRWTTEELLSFPDIRETVEGLLPYTERHFQRISLLEQQGTFVHFLWNTMKISGCDT